jgi:WD40 repeat protein
VCVRGVLPIVDVVFSGDGKSILTVDEGGRVRAWGCDGDRLSQKFADQVVRCKERPVRSAFSRPFRSNWIDASADGDVVAVVAHDNSVEVIELPGTGRPTSQTRRVVPGERTPADETLQVNAVALSADGDYLASARLDEYVRVYRVGRGANPGEGDVSNDKVRHDTKRVNYVAFSHDRGPRPRLASVGDDGTVRLWNVDDTGTDAARFPPASAPSSLRPVAGGLIRVAFNLDGTCLVTLGADKQVRGWDLRADQPGRLGAEVFSFFLADQEAFNVGAGQGFRVAISTTDSLQSRSVHRFLTFELDRDQLLKIAEKRHLPPLTEELEKGFFPVGAGGKTP